MAELKLHISQAETSISAIMKMLAASQTRKSQLDKGVLKGKGDAVSGDAG